MLTGKHVAVIGGDARQLEVIRKLIELDAKISLIGFDQLDEGFVGATKVQLEHVDFRTVEAIVLPVSGTSLEGEIETIFSNEKIVLKVDHLKATPEYCTVFSGISNQYLKKIVKDADRKLVELFERNDVAIYNSIPTMEGTLMMVIQNTDITIHRSNVVVLGFGRVGMTVARAFHALGASVKVAANQSNLLARIYEMGFEPIELSKLESKVENTDVCINTIPAKVLTAKIISKMPTRSLIIDLASKPGGTDFRYAEKRGIKAMLAPGLPGIVAPKTAGQIIANVLSKLLIEEQNNIEEDQS
ncbi:dipicolinic acid synthetase subunit A [Anaerobacillus alkalidiazotrophicus]|uniref:Dipicolinic acid synthetase subunit A n=1 Tax=Anaerobacillus alkalidiazotrophicus TaxID=472963 RepID=A0A1S2M1S9_9BACI|nr:dipicolinic acid synthetase subunit A [Anaerobacillus alkalidiazotrophicus]OIJ17887.1 dipicolinic acid synthetase subunit A [Anaerobacillus alkalidiazotrophicus]